MMVDAGQRGIRAQQFADTNLDIAITRYDDSHRLVWWNAAEASFFPKANYTLVSGTSLKARSRSFRDAGYGASSRRHLDAPPGLKVQELGLPDGRRLIRQRVRLASGATLIVHIDVNNQFASAMTSQAQLERERNSLIIEGARDGIYDRDIVNDFTWYSSQAHAILGLPDGALNGSRNLVLDRVHPRDGEKHRVSIAAAYAVRQRVTSSTRRIRHADGTWRWVTSRGVVLYSESGEAVRSVGSWSDITAFKQSEERLRESEHRYSLVLEAAQEGLFDRDLVANKLWFSSKVHEILGLPDESLNVGPEVIRNRMHADDFSDFVKTQRDASARGDSRFEGACRILHADGSWRWIATDTRIVYAADGKPARYVGSVRDVTAQKEVERELELKRSEIRRAAIFRAAVLKSLPGLVAILDENGVIAEVNAEWREFAASNGASTALMEGVGVSYFAVCESVASRLPDRSVADCLREVLQGSLEELNFDYPCHSPNKQRWFQMTARRIDSSPPGLVISYLDITGRVRAEQDILESKARLAAILNTAMVGIISVDDRGRIIAFNAEAENVFQYSARDVIGQSVNILLPPAFREAHQRRMTDFAEGDAAQRAMSTWREVNGQRRDGTLVPLMAGVSKTSVGGKLTLTVIFRDMSETVESEKALKALTQERERQMHELTRHGLLVQSVMDTVPDGVVIMRPANGNVFWNRGYLALTGITKYTSTVDQIANATRAQLLSALTIQQSDIDVLASNASEARECLAENGRMLRIRLLPVGDGSTLLWVSDITERRAEEVERMALQERLLQSQKNDAIGAMAGTVAHDFNNLLTIILGFSALGQSQLEVLKDLPKRLPTDDPLAKRVVQHLAGAASSIAKSLTNITNGAIRGREIVAHLTSFARGKPSELALLDLATTVKVASRPVSVSLPSSISLSTSGLDQSFLVRHDRGRIEQVLLNLCINSTHAIGDRAGAITWALAPDQVDGGRARSLAGIEASDPHRVLITQQTADGWTTLWQGVIGVGDFVRLDVTDTGSGMSAETMRRIFDPFFTTKPQGQGTGLGLLSVARIIEEHGGAIQVRSRPGVGTMFSIFLPLAGKGEIEVAGSVPVAAEVAEPSQVTAKSDTDLRRLLVVDDEQPLTEVFAQTLEKAGYLVESHNCPGDALASFEAHPQSFAMVITDQMMPSILGTDLASRIHHANPDVPVLLCTGYLAKALNKDNLPPNIVGILKKPFAPSDLVATVGRILTKTE